MKYTPNPSRKWQVEHDEAVRRLKRDRAIRNWERLLRYIDWLVMRAAGKTKSCGGRNIQFDFDEPKRESTSRGIVKHAVHRQGYRGPLVWEDGTNPGWENAVRTLEDRG